MHVLCSFAPCISFDQPQIPQTTHLAPDCNDHHWNQINDLFSFSSLHMFIPVHFTNQKFNLVLSGNFFGRLLFVKLFFCFFFVFIPYEIGLKIRLNYLSVKEAHICSRYCKSINSHTVVKILLILILYIV